MSTPSEANTSPRLSVHVRSTSQSLSDESPPPLPARDQAPSSGFSPVHPFQIQHANNNAAAPERCNLCSRMFWCNKFNLFRLCMFVVMALFLCISLLYAYGQFYALTYADYYCEPKSHAEIRAHSQAHGLNGGTNEDCWTTSSYQLDEQKIFESSSLTAFEAKQMDDIHAGVVIKAAIYFIPALILLYALIHCSVLLFGDCTRFYLNSWHTHTLQLTRSRLTGIAATCCFQCLQKCLKSYGVYFGVDRPGWVLFSLFRESLEVVIQSVALLKYGGAQSALLYLFHSRDTLILAEDKKWILAFSVVLSLNCVCTSMLWLCYLCKHSVFYGRFMVSITTLIDCVFDTFYVIFPLLLLGRDYDFNTTAATIGESSSLLFLIATYVPLLFIAVKLFMITMYASRAAREQWIYEAKQREFELRTLSLDLSSMRSRIRASTVDPRTVAVARNVEIPRVQDARPQVATDAVIVVRIEERNSHKCKILCYGHKYLQEPQLDDEWKPFKMKIYQLRRAFLLCWSVCVFLFGISLVIFVPVHFRNAQQFCDEYALREDVRSHPEMKLWQFCNFKVYPLLASDLPCNCRSFAMQQRDVLNHTRFLRDENPNTVTSMFQHFYMLESVLIKCDRESVAECQNIYDIDFYSSPPRTLALRALYLDAIKTINISETNNEALYNAWENIEVAHLDLSFTGVPQMTSGCLQKWTKMQHIDTRWMFYDALDFVCEMPDLKFMRLEAADLSSIPRCLAEQLHKLEVLDLSWNQYISALDVNIFSMPSLQQFTWIEPWVESSRLTSESFGSEVFEWRDDVQFTLGGSAVCLEYYNYNEILSSTDTYNMSDSDSFIFSFLNQTNACTPICEGTGSSYANLKCSPDLFGNGVCEESCNFFDCGYDHGDCVQLCQCDAELLFNEQCDELCNTPECNYDSLVCLDDFNADYSVCDERSKCKSEWIHDGSCDDFCREHVLCDYDGDDCECPGDGACSFAWEYWYTVAASLSSDYWVDSDEMCLWQSLVFPDWNISCSEAFEIADMNQDNLISFYEFNYSWWHFGNDTLGQYKAKQTNCSACAPSLDAYYGPNYQQTISEIQKSYLLL